MLKGSSCLCEVRASGGVRPWGGAAAVAWSRAATEGLPLKAADAGNAQLDELAARAQHL